MPSTSISLEITGEIARISLNPPGNKPPTLDESSLQELDTILEEIEGKASGIRVVILASRSDKFFCVGANIEALKEINENTIVPWVALGHRIFNRLEDLPMPNIARVSGYALGGGLELAMACDLIFATGDAKLGLPEAKMGFIPGWGGCHRFADRVGTSAAKRYFFTAGILDATKALQMGLVDFVGSSEDLDKEIEVFARQISECSSFAVSAFKRIVNDERRTARERNTEAEVRYSPKCLQDPDTAKRLYRFLNSKSNPKTVP